MNQLSQQRHGRTSRRTTGIATIVAVGCLRAQPIESPEAAAERSSLVHKASAAALQNLIETVAAIPLDTDARVADFLAESGALRERFAVELNRIASTSPPRWYSDESVEVDRFIEYATLRQTLQTLHRDVYRGARFQSNRFDAAFDTQGRTWVYATGVGVPFDEASSTGPAGADASAHPAGWQNINPAGVLMARRAAVLDAERQIIEQVRTRPFQGDATFHDLFRRQPRKLVDLRVFLESASIGDPRFARDGTCTVPMAIDVAPWIARHLSANTQRSTDTASGSPSSDGIRVEGMSVAPPAHRRAKTASADQAGSPPWAREKLRAIGRSSRRAASQDDSVSIDAALAAAVAAGYRDLAEQLDDVKIDARTTVSDFLAVNTTASSDIATFWSAARLVATRPVDAGGAQAVVEIPLERLWRIVTMHRQP